MALNFDHVRTAAVFLFRCRRLPRLSPALRPLRASHEVDMMLEEPDPPTET